MIQGLTYTYGISSIPGTLVDNIYISKGANSVLQGFESISGQINVTTKNGLGDDKVFLNAYMNSFGEKQFNVNLATEKSGWNNLLALHTVQPANEIDRDNDKFSGHCAQLFGRVGYWYRHCTDVSPNAEYCPSSSCSGRYGDMKVVCLKGHTYAMKKFQIDVFVS